MAGMTPTNPKANGPVPTATAILCTYTFSTSLKGLSFGNINGQIFLKKAQANNADAGTSWKPNRFAGQIENLMLAPETL